MKLYFLDMSYYQHGRRNGYFFFSLNEATDFICSVLLEEYEEDSKEIFEKETIKIKNIVETFISSPNKSTFRRSIYSDGKILCSGEIKGYEFVIIELSSGDRIDLE